jgi:hypothetical protein
MDFFSSSHATGHAHNSGHTSGHTSTTESQKKKDNKDKDKESKDHSQSGKDSFGEEEHDNIPNMNITVHNDNVNVNGNNLILPYTEKPDLLYNFKLSSFVNTLKQSRKVKNEERLIARTRVLIPALFGTGCDVSVISNIKYLILNIKYQISYNIK